MVYILYGADSFLLKERLEEIIVGLGKTELLDFNTQRLDGSTVTPEQFANICQALPFMVSRRLVIVEGLLDRFERRETRPAPSPTKDNTGFIPLESKPPGNDSVQEVKKGWLPFSDIIKNVPETTVLVLVDGDLKRNNPLLAELSGKAQVKFFQPLKEEALFQWVQHRAVKYGLYLSTELISYIIDLLGDNLWVIDSELQKLRLFAGDNAVKMSDVEQVVSYSREHNIFQLVDAILQRRTKRALELLQQLQKAGAEPPYILTMLTREIRRMLLAKLAAAGTVIPPELAKELKLVEEKHLRIIGNKAKRYPRTTLEEFYHRILQTDISMKTGKLDAVVAIELLVGEICESAPPVATAR